jgi:hypothetical protein
MALASIENMPGFKRNFPLSLLYTLNFTCQLPILLYIAVLSLIYAPWRFFNHFFNHYGHQPAF